MTDTHSQGTILVVDDHAPAAEMLSQIFVMRGYDAVTVNSGQEALEVARTVLPDVILLDVMMPGMDGYEVMEELRKSDVTADIPIILVTAKDDVADIEQGLGLGADDYVPKPVKPREMLARVRSKIEAHKLRNELKKRTTQLGALLRFSQELNTEQNVDSLMDMILFLVLDLIPCDVAIVYHLNNQGDILTYMQQYRTDYNQQAVEAETLHHNLPQNETITVWSNEQLSGTEYSSGIAVRLEHGEHLHGLLVVLSDNTYTQSDAHMFETIARQTTLALRNAETYEYLEEMVEQRTQELRSAEQLLIRSEKLASVGRLAAGIAHEINNPLMPIRMNLELMQEDIVNGDAVSERDIEETLHSVNRISRIVERLQQFTRGRGEDVPEMEPLVVADVIENVLQLTYTYTRHGGVKVITKLDSEARTYGNRDQLEQVFLNIILNGQAAMEGGGELLIETAQHDKDTVITISDTGHGIEPDLIDKIFEPFISTKETGSGLGLFMSHNIIHNHSGQIEVSSEVGKGTTFVITLPTLLNEAS